MAEQLTGVLREVLAVADGKPRPAFSALFSPELHAIGADGAERRWMPLTARRRPRPRSWPGSRCLRWTRPTRRPASWPR